MTVDYDKEADFRSYKTFAYRAGKIVVPPELGGLNNDILERRFQSALTAQLESKGFQKAADGVTPDMFVTYSAGALEKSDLTPVNFGASVGVPIGRYGWWNVGMNRYMTRRYKEGTLVVDVADAKSGQLVWRVYAKGEITKLPDDKTVNAVIGRVLKDFPPLKK
jgi:hypothetical protein